MTTFWQSSGWKNTLLYTSQANIIEYKNILIEKRSIWFWFYWLFIIWIENNSLINEEEIIKICKDKKAVFLQIETFSFNNNIELKLNKFKKWFFKKFITPYTLIIDLKLWENTILSQMKPKWRYNINLASKKWCVVNEVDKTDENIKIFYDLMTETISRDNFNGNTFFYYKSFLNNIKESFLVFIYFEWKVISAGIFVFYKKVSIYYYWASTSIKEYRNLMAPYAMQWYVIKKSIENKMEIYDFLWVKNPHDNDESLSGVTDFKTKFSSSIVNCSEWYIYINYKIIYYLFFILKKIKYFLKK